MSDIDAQSKKLLSVLLAHLSTLSDVDIENPKKYITYTQACERIGLTIQKGDNVGKILQNNGLNSLANWTQSNGIPAISGLIVNRTDYTPGSGYFKQFFGKKDINFDLWLKKLKMQNNLIGIYF